MKQKKEDAGIKCNAFLHKISSHDRIEELSSIIKEFFKEALKIRYELTFLELKSLIAKKHILPETSLKVSSVCDMFENLEYRPKKPAKNEISKLKKLLKEVIKDLCPGEKEEERPALFNKLIEKAEKVKKKKEKHERIIEKVEKVKEDITKEIIRKVKEDEEKESLDIGLDINIDKECREIAHFMDISLKLGMKVREIRKELKDMGFQNNKIDAVIKNSKKS